MLGYVLLAGLAGAVVNQAVQFLFIVAAFFTVAVMGMKEYWRMDGLKARAPVVLGNGCACGPAAGIVGLFPVGVCSAAGDGRRIFGFCRMRWPPKTAETARRIPLVAAAVRLFFCPFC